MKSSTSKKQGLNAVSSLFPRQQGNLSSFSDQAGILRRIGKRPTWEGMEEIQKDRFFKKAVQKKRRTYE